MDLGDRMKTYENVTKSYLIRRMPVIIRVDGKAFHTLTRGLDKPFDERFESVMNLTAFDVAHEIQNCVFAYIQSDEVSFLLKDYTTLQTEAWFRNSLQKLVSVSAAKMSVFFNMYLASEFDRECCVEVFDARAFNLTKEEVCNYFIWRQQDATRNSIQGLAQAHFSHKELHGLNTNQLQDKLMLEKRINWNDLPVSFKRGRCIIVGDSEIDLPPIFTQDRDYIDRFLDPEET